MSFFDLPEPQKYFDGGTHEQEDIAVYTWGEDSYDGLGDALLEGGDELNDETFGGIGPVGKDFDFQHQPSLSFHRDSPQPGTSHAVSPPHHDGKDNQISEAPKISSLWESKSMLSTMPRLRNQTRPTAQPSTVPGTATALTGQTRMRTLAEIEEEMRANAQRSRETQANSVSAHQNGSAINQGAHGGRQTELSTPPQRFAPPSSVDNNYIYSSTEYSTSMQQPMVALADYRDLSQPQQHPQLPIRATPPQHLPISELQDLSLRDQHRRLSPFTSNHARHPSDTGVPDPFTVQQMGYGSRGHGPSMDSQAQHALLLKQMNVHHTVQPSIEMRNYVQSMQRPQQFNEQHEQLKQRATRQIMEQELMEAKRRRKLAKISRMSRNNDLMTQSDKDFITRIQVSQLMMGDPYQEDFYNQVFQSLIRNRSGPGDNMHPKHGPRTGRRQNALQRMEAQVERIINNVRLREKEKDSHSLHHLQGALGKTSGRSYKAAPRQLLQVDGGEVHGGEKQKTHTRNGLSQDSTLDSEGVALHSQDPNHPLNLNQNLLSDKEVLMRLEDLYEMILQLEHLRREQPPMEDEEAFDAWSMRRGNKLAEFSVLFPINAPDSSSIPSHLVALLRPQKGKKLIQRILRQLDKSQQLELLLMIINDYSKLDVVAYASALDSPIPTREREELEIQTDIFMHNVLSNFLPLIGELSLAPIIHMVAILLRRTNAAFVARSQPGIALLTALFSQAAHLKHLALTEGPDSNFIISPQDLSRWQTVYDQLFDVLTPHFVTIFPSTRMSMILTKDSEPYLPPPVVIDALDQPVWNFLATFAVHSSSEEQQIMVTILREKVLDTVLSASQEWSAEGGAHRIANVNLFLNALGLDASQIAF